MGRHSVCHNLLLVFMGSLVTQLLNLKAYLFELEKSKMEFIIQLNKLSMAYLAVEKELIGKKERSFLHVLEF